jgi:hypothetical protein
MSWERDPLWAKARLFFERAFDESRESPNFGLLCSFGLELLARSALASISPTLLAEPDRDQKNLLHALNRGSERTPRKSISTVQVFSLCCTLFPNFTKDDFTASMALINRRNEELHSGAAAFAEYPPSQWLGGFYRACTLLSAAMGENLINLFGKEEAKAASEILTENQKEVKKSVEKSIASHREVFAEKSADDRKKAAAEAAKLGEKLAMLQHHRVTCPACKCVATVQGRPFGKEHISNKDDMIVVRQAVVPTSFACSACELKLEGYAQLDAAGLGGHYQRKTTFSPEEYYGLINPDDIGSYVEEYLSKLEGEEYDNE